MNWKTKEIRDWLDEAGILNSQKEDILKLQELVESKLLIRGKYINSNDYLTNIAITEFLKNVQWEELVHNPNAFDDWG